jgi:hypothetical protein
MFHMRTDTSRHYVSTRYLEVMNTYETMVFRKEDGKIDWGDIETKRTKHQRIAAWHHYKIVRDLDGRK